MALALHMIETTVIQPIFLQYFRGYKDERS